ncbi:MAG: hypothetical protein IT469_02310 [Pseudomonadales bacterium]|nr:hypothetical protein [Pseudomonadales bacterium]
MDEVRVNDSRLRRHDAAFPAALGLLAAFALWLAVTRIYQVDEAQNLYMAKVIARGQVDTYFSNALLWMLGPLSWLIRSIEDSASLFLAMRLLFFGVFCLNVWLLAAATGVPLRSTQGRVALLGAATLAPLWDYGFEFRHDNLILAGLLLIWWLGRVRARGLGAFAAIGFLTAVLLFTAGKAFAYVLPLSGALALCSPIGCGRRLRLLAVWVGGVAAGVALALLAYWLSGLWDVFVAGLPGGGNPAEVMKIARFGPGMALARLPAQTPLLLGLAAGALLALGHGLLRERGRALAWDSYAPEAVLALGALGLLWVNPTPFPYNLVNVVPFLFLLGFRFAAPLCKDLRGPTLALAVGVVLFTHVVPFVMATWRHLDWPNDRQVRLMRAAEALTDPVRDPVYDGTGMVPTRESIGRQWLLHSLGMPAVLAGKVPSLAEMLARRPAPVLIRNYRAGWLPESDQRFIAEHYIPLADDFLVLGQVLPEGGGSYAVLHAGRYRVYGMADGGLRELPEAAVDGRPAGEQPVELVVGLREIRCPPDIEPVVLWVGPNLRGIPDLGAGDHRRLFVNWY